MKKGKLLNKDRSRYFGKNNIWLPVILGVLLNFEESYSIQQNFSLKPINNAITPLKIASVQKKKYIFMAPLKYNLSSCFGKRRGGRHDGIDIAARKNTPVQNSGTGVVQFAGFFGGYGKTVIIESKGYQILYGHLNKIEVSKGQKVAKGEIIGLVGATGKSSGHHLHFEIRKNGYPINPILLTKDLSRYSQKKCTSKPRMHYVSKSTPTYNSSLPKIALIPSIGSPNSTIGLYGATIEIFKPSGLYGGLGYGEYNSYPFIDSSLGLIEQNNMSLKFGKIFGSGKLLFSLNSAVTRMLVSTKIGAAVLKNKKKSKIKNNELEFWSINPQIGFYFLNLDNLIINMEYGRYISLNGDYQNEYNGRIFSHGDKSPKKKAPLDTFRLGIGVYL